jgi:Trypsin-like peptidase domain
MIEPASVPEQLMYVTVRTAALDDHGLETSVGTGFLYNFRVDDQKSIPALITNKHVVRNSAAVGIIVHTKVDGKSPPEGNERMSIPGHGDVWVDARGEIDLCGIPILPHLPANAFYRSLDDSLLPTEEQIGEFDAIEDVIMVGYPSGLWDSVHNYPLIRRGITATHPALDFDGRPNVVVDLACFPGSSGSPVFIYNQSGYATKSGGIRIGSGRIIFLGVLFAGPTITADGEVVIEEAPTGIRGDVRIRSMMNLGYIIKAREVLALGADLIAKYGKHA